MTTALDVFEIAPGWSEVPFKGIAEKVSESGFPNLESLSVFLDAGVVPRSSREDNHNQLGESLDKYQRVLPNDLVFNKLRTWQGGFGISSYEGIVSPAYIIARPNLKLIEPRFLGYLLKSRPYLTELTRLSKWMPPTQFDISWESIRDLKLRIPPIEEQKKIADYLDEQINLVNRTIDAKIRVLELNEAAYMAQIRKLLNPPEDQEKMENEGWVTKRVAWLFKTGSGTTPTSDKSEYFEGSIPWVNSGDLNDSIVNASKTCVSEAALKDFSPLRMYPEGSLLVAMYGATVGKTGILGMEACVNQAVCVLHTEGELTTSFAHFWFIVNRNNLIEQSVGGGQPNINQEIIRSQRISFPSSEGQHRIVGEMQEITNQRKFRSEIVEKSIGLLVEYKDSLITSSVTGCFDAAIGKRSAK